MIRSFHQADFSAERILEAKHARRISVCIPARDEEATVGQVVAAIRTALIERHAVVDELVVIDDGSSDRTAEAARDAGAEVISAGERPPGHIDDHGKGQALWRGVQATTGDIVAFCDADIRNFDDGFIRGIVGPLLLRDELSLVKAFYQRPLDGRPGEGGRVTELVARPLISMFFPHLAPLVQPLSGEFAARREVLESVPFVCGYGVDLGLLVDVAARFGSSSIAQCDLGERTHRNRPLHELSGQAMAIMQLAFNRAGLDNGSVGGLAMAPPWSTGWPSTLLRPGGEPLVVTHEELPPICELPGQRMTA
jgi:glucosyl-3-phosphoglycerate synthase